MRNCGQSAKRRAAEKNKPLHRKGLKCSRSWTRTNDPLINRSRGLRTAVSVSAKWLRRRSPGRLRRGPIGVRNWGQKPSAAASAFGTATTMSHVLLSEAPRSPQSATE
jgi:hypothetical protein